MHALFVWSPITGYFWYSDYIYYYGPILYDKLKYIYQLINEFSEWFLDTKPAGKVLTETINTIPGANATLTLTGKIMGGLSSFGDYIKGLSRI
jgi:hypothetical protein